ncbi:methyl-accepting chemotaxis protein [[Clostridium] colinum]|uniref:methyl-accepting chemotaxis protein n=1 Tax=[Clostridium] colinum TaxID=36835 RepID=UPI00202478DB|nr:methyl-accepting chemotaxis protein [[Clostridium] colinum]
MNFYKNLKLKVRFGVVVTILAILVVTLGFYGSGALRKLDKNFVSKIESVQNVNNDIINSIPNIVNIRFVAYQTISYIAKKEFNTARNNLTLAYEKSRNILENYLSNLNEFYIDNNSESLKNDLISKYNSALVLLDEYYEGVLEYINFSEQGDLKKVAEKDASTTTTIEQLFDILYSLPDLTFSIMVNDLNTSSKNISRITTNLFVLTIVIVALIYLFMISLSRSITKPVAKIKNAALEVLKGNLDVDIRSNIKNELGDLSNSIANMSGTIQCIIDDINSLSEHLEMGETSYRINTQKYSGAFKDATEDINNAVNGLVEDSVYVANCIKEIEDGEFDNDIKELPGDKDVSTHALKNIQTTLKTLSTEINSLVNEAINGNLEYKLDSTQYDGQWKLLLDGLNEFIDKIVGPIKEVQNSLNEFSIGNFSYRISSNYKGEFNKIKESVNSTGQSINSYILEISTILNEMANKNFDVSINREYLGDFKTIQKSVNLIVENLNALTRDIIDSAEQVSASAKQISESSISLAEGATQQTESVEKLTYIMSDIEDQIKENSKNSNKANKLSIETRENASKGSEQMNSMLNAMEDINNASSSISNIIKVIDDIAFQTNILALNAAVEAARAGEHGKGFAVVAEEVRSLAARSQQAARETTELIESSVQKVAEGSKIANQTADALLTIVQQIEDISKIIDSSAKSSLEQEKFIHGVADAISKIAYVTINNTATSQESAASSEELASQAEVFYASVADFKLKNDDKKVDIVNVNTNSNKPIIDNKIENQKPTTNNNKSNTENVNKPTTNKNKSINIDLSSDDLIILDDETDIIINESLDFGKY